MRSRWNICLRQANCSLLFGEFCGHCLPWIAIIFMTIGTDVVGVGLGVLRVKECAWIDTAIQQACSCSALITHVLYSITRCNFCHNALCNILKYKDIMFLHIQNKNVIQINIYVEPQLRGDNRHYSVCFYAFKFERFLYQI